MPGDKAWCCWLVANDANYVFAVEITRYPQEGLLAIVVVLFPILEEPVMAADGAAGQLGQNGPPRERPGALAHVRLRVVPHAHAKELQQLASPVFIHGRGMVF